MKPNWVATLYAGIFKTVFRFAKNLGTVLIMSIFLVLLSCDKNDDLETIGKEPPIQNNLPNDNEPPTDDESATDDGSIIVYTDIEPDFKGENLKDCYDLNLNNDQIVDFTICPGSDSGMEWLGIGSSANSKNGIISVAPWYTQAIPLDYGLTIFNLVGYRNGEFYENGSLISIGYCFAGEKDCPYDWSNKVDRYLGLRFIINGKTHYGWAQLEVVSATQWVIKDYAYNATPNKPILAGQKE